MSISYDASGAPSYSLSPAPRLSSSSNISNTNSPAPAASPSKAMLAQEAARREVLLQRLREQQQKAIAAVSTPPPPQTKQTSTPSQRNANTGLAAAIDATLALQARQVGLLERLIAATRAQDVHNIAQTCEDLLVAQRGYDNHVAAFRNSAPSIPTERRISAERQAKQLDELLGLLGDALGSLQIAHGGSRRDDAHYLGQLASNALDILNTGNATASALMQLLTATSQQQQQQQHRHDGASLGALRGEVESLQTVSDEMLDQIKTIVSDTDDAVAKLTKENERLASDNERLRQLARKADAAATDAERRAEAAERELAVLRAISSPSSSTARSMSQMPSSSSSVAAAAAAHEAELEARDRAHGEKIQKLAELTTQLRNGLEATEAQRKAEQHRADAAAREVETLRATIAALQGALSKAEATAQQLVDKEGELMERLFHVEAHTADRDAKREEELAESRKLVSSLRARVKELESEAQRQFERGEKLQAARDEVRRRLEQKEDEVAQVRGELERVKRMAFSPSSTSTTASSPPLAAAATTEATAAAAAATALREKQLVARVKQLEDTVAALRSNAAAMRPLPPATTTQHQQSALHQAPPRVNLHFNPHESEDGRFESDEVDLRDDSRGRPDAATATTTTDDDGGGVGGGGAALLDAESAYTYQPEVPHSSILRETTPPTPHELVVVPAPRATPPEVTFADEVVAAAAPPAAAASAVTINTANATPLNVMKVLADAKNLLTEVSNQRRNGVSGAAAAASSSVSGRAGMMTTPQKSTRPAAMPQQPPQQPPSGQQQQQQQTSSLVGQSVARLLEELRAQEERLLSEAASLESQEAAVNAKRSVVSSTLLAQRNQLLMKNAPDREIETLNDQISSVMQKINQASAQIEVNKRSVASKLDLVRRQLRNTEKMVDQHSRR